MRAVAAVRVVGTRRVWRVAAIAMMAIAPIAPSGCGDTSADAPVDRAGTATGGSGGGNPDAGQGGSGQAGSTASGGSGGSFDAGAAGVAGSDATVDVRDVSDSGGDRADADGSAVIATDPAPLTQTDSFYPRVIRLTNGTIVASVVAPQPSGRLGGTILESTDDGLSFTQIGRIDSTRAAPGLCCATLYELPSALGSLPAGTLLWAASVGGDTPDAPMSIPVFTSPDRGRSWTYLSDVTVASVPRSTGGLWEPEFSQLDDGRLICHWSDETDPKHSQKLVAARSADGTLWIDQHDVVAVSATGGRPGMAVVRRAVGGDYVLSYELCGADGCTSHLKRSTDGWTFGDVTDPGVRPATLDGEHFRHAPNLAVSAAPGIHGRQYLVGQLLFGANGQQAARSGTVLFANTEDGFGNWYALPAPIPIPEAFDNYCPNYSSPLLPLDNGASVLELASRSVNGRCRTFFAKGSLRGSGGTTAPGAGTYRVRNLMSGHCLDVAASSAAAGAAAQQQTCATASSQGWEILSPVDGIANVRNGNSGLCLGAQGSAPASVVAQIPCTTATRWKLENVGIDVFKVIDPSSGLCLDVAAGSTASGAAVRVWTCNDLAPQIWAWRAP
jgi:hypothetical protein